MQRTGEKPSLPRSRSPGRGKATERASSARGSKRSYPDNDRRPWDAAGLRKAYASATNVWIDHEHNTVYTAGTQIDPFTNPGGLEQTVGDLALDAFRVPTMTLAGTQRYEQVKRILQQNPHLNTVVGHSLGSATLNQLVSDMPRWHGRARLYADPSISWGSFSADDPRIDAFRHPFDPISILDRNAQMSLTDLRLNPHTYTGQGAGD